MRLLLLLTLCWLNVVGALAQVAVPVAAPVPEVTTLQAPLATDTVAALHNLFKDKRRLRSRVVLGTLAVAVAGFGLVSATAGGRNGFVVLGDLAALTLLGVPGVGIELLYYGQYSRRNERFAIEDFQAHKLPRRVRQRLEPEYFQAPK